MQPNTDLVSVIIPTFNRARTILEALDSVRHQTYRPIEVLVVDDGSTDDTAQLVSDWSDHYSESAQLEVRYEYQENQGGSIARNNGAGNARGVFIAFLDSDDRWMPAKLEKQLALLRANADFGAAYCGVQVVDLETGGLVGSTRRAYPTGWLLEMMLVRDVTAPTSTYVMRREVFSVAGSFDPQLSARQDWDMWIRVAARFQIGATPEALVEYRVHAGPTTISNPQNEIEAYRRILAKYADLRAACAFPVRQAAKAAYYRRLGRVHFHQRISITKAVYFQLRSVLAWPFAFDSYAALLGLALPSVLRSGLRRTWNGVFGRTRLSINSH